MQIELHLPNEFDAKVMYDEKRRVLTITPTSVRGRRTMSLAGVAVNGKTGRNMRAVLGVNLANGQPALMRQAGAEADTPFDEAADKNPT